MLRGGRFLVASFAGATVGLGSFYLQDEKAQRKAIGLLNASSRIVNLVSTAGAISVDYGYMLFWKDREFRAELHSCRQKLRAAQEEQEALHLKLFKLQKNHPDIVNASLTDEAKERILDQLLLDIEENEKVLRNLSSHVADLVVKTKDRYSAIHQRNATRLRDMCASNKGLYIKLGQHIAMLDYVFPLEYHTTLTTLLASNPQSSFESIQRTFLEDFGVPLESVFTEFDPIPIGSASLAQVHIASLNNQKVAVKVQHEGLLEGSTLDRYVITKIVDFLPTIFPDFDYRWLTREMNQNLPQELDFLKEADNINECRRILKSFIDKGDVAVPETKLNYCSPRVLTMSYESGVHLNNKQKVVEEWKLNPLQISDCVSRVFCEQIYRHGFVHCDPHEANLLVRPHPSKPNRAQIVLLDHGLYRRLKDDFRHDYCRLWQGLILCDEGKIEEYCRRLGAGDMYSLLAAMLTLKPWNEIVTPGRKNSGSDVVLNINELAQSLEGGKKDKAQQVMLQSYAAQYFKEIVQLLGKVPSDLLLLFKTNDCLRHLDHILETPVNSTQVVAEVVADVIIREDIHDILKTESSLSSTLKALWQSATQWINLQMRVWLLTSLKLYLAFTGSLRA